MRHVFKMAAAFPRVRRVYLYNWRFDGNKRWDSGLISDEGTERMAYYALPGGAGAGPLQAGRRPALAVEAARLALPALGVGLRGGLAEEADGDASFGDR